jgi:PAS domain S-box-containing protein
MFWELDREFRVLYANELFRRVFGDPVGRVCHDFMCFGEAVCPGCPVVRVFNGEERAVSERMRIDKDGRKIWLRHTACPVKNAAGEVVGASELTIDITDRKRMEEDLRESEHRYRNLVEQVPDIIFSLDKDGKFSFVNIQMEHFLGYPVNKILETPLTEYVLPEDKPTVQYILQLKPEEIWDEEVGILDASGGKKFARIRCKASYGDHGGPVGFEGVMRDRTTRRKLEQDLRKSKEALTEKIRIIDELYEHIVHTGMCKAIEEHTAEVAHELRQPLAIVGGFARRMAKQLEVEEGVDMAKHKQYAEIIVSEVLRLERILDRLIDFTTRDVVHLQRIDPNMLIDYILSITESRRLEKNVRIEKKYGPEVGEVMVDPGRFQQLVLNLLTNAVEASPQGGAVEVETGASIPSEKALKSGRLESESYFELKIRNVGAVLPPDELRQVFSPFRSALPNQDHLPGLTLSKKIVEDHQGSLSLKSDGRGTVFTVWLPLQRREDAACVLQGLS